MITFLQYLREAWGCPDTPHRHFRWHDFQWNVGPHGWWMYCVYCGKGVWKT